MPPPPVPESKIAEDWPLEPHPQSRGLYSQTKLEAEQIVSDGRPRQRKLRAIILRPGEVVGPDKPFLSGAAAIDAGKWLVVLGNGRFTLPVIWIEDLVDAIMAAANSDHFDGSVVQSCRSRTAVARRRGEVLSRRDRQAARSIVHAPLSLLYCAAFGADRLFRMLGRNAPITPYRLRSAIGRRDFDCTAGRQTVGLAAATSACARVCRETSPSQARRTCSLCTSSS